MYCNTTLHLSPRAPRATPSMPIPTPNMDNSTRLMDITDITNTTSNSNTPLLYMSVNMDMDTSLRPNLFQQAPSLRLFP